MLHSKNHGCIWIIQFKRQIPKKKINSNAIAHLNGGDFIANHIICMHIVVALADYGDKMLTIDCMILYIESKCFAPKSKTTFVNIKKKHKFINLINCPSKRNHRKNVAKWLLLWLHHVYCFVRHKQTLCRTKAKMVLPALWWNRLFCLRRSFLFSLDDCIY